MQWKHLTAMFLTGALPLVAARGGGPGNARGQGQNTNERNNGVRTGNDNTNNRGDRGSNTVAASAVGRPFRITASTIGETPKKKSYFTQPQVPTNPWMLYTTPSVSKSEIFHVDKNKYLWYNSTNPELEGPIYSFFYTDKLQGDSTLRYVGFWIKEGIEEPEYEMEFFKWCVDFEDKSIELVYPEGLVLATCETEIEDLGVVDEWFVSTPPFVEGNGCQRIEIGIEEVLYRFRGLGVDDVVHGYGF